VFFGDKAALVDSCIKQTIWEAIVQGCCPDKDPQPPCNVWVISGELNSSCNEIALALKTCLDQLGIRIVRQLATSQMINIDLSSDGVPAIPVMVCSNTPSDWAKCFDSFKGAHGPCIIVATGSLLEEIHIGRHRWMLAAGSGRRKLGVTISNDSGPDVLKGIGLQSGGGAVIYPDGSVETILRSALFATSQVGGAGQSQKYLLEPCGNYLNIPRGLTQGNSPTSVVSEWVSLGDVLAFTGAGISAESGVPTYRDAGGLWTKYDQMQVSSLPGFVHDPDQVWEFEREFFSLLDGVQPNAGHAALAALEQAGLVKCIITQNVDGLHQSAGSEQVVELHGSEVHGVCLNKDCSKRTLMKDIFASKDMWGSDDPAVRDEMREQLQRILRRSSTPSTSSSEDESSSANLDEGLEKGKLDQSKVSVQAQAVDDCTPVTTEETSQQITMPKLDSSSPLSRSSSSSSSRASSPRQPPPKPPKADALHRVPICPFCQRGVLKPDGVYFGEALNTKVLQQATGQAKKAKTVLVVGTRGNVEPARQLPLLAKKIAGARIVEINPNETLLSKHADIRLRGSSAAVLPEIARRALILRGAVQIDTAT